MRLHFRGLFLFIILALTIFMILEPRESFQAAAAGFKLWYAVLVPALLPFFIVAELLISSGFTHYMGRILEPVMRPLFHLPGCSSLVMVMGFTSGFPMGAVLSRRLYEEKLLTPDEAERLATFTNNSSPLFIIGAVGVGMFGNPHLGYILALSHYLSNLLVGLIWSIKSSFVPVPHSTFLSLEKASPPRFNPGSLLGESIKNSLNNLLAIAGFIVFFSVLTRMTVVTGIMDMIADIFQFMLGFCHLPHGVALGMGMGLFEITLGCQTVSQVPQGEILFKLLAISAILAFSGFSIIAQVLSILAGTPVRPRLYLLSRLLQVILSLPLTAIIFYLWPPVQPSISLPGRQLIYSFDAWTISMSLMLIGLGAIGAMVLIGLLWQKDQ
jgi:sporulation integral membrane protein YlbJ